MVSKRLSGEAGHRRKFMAIVDGTPECNRAVRYAGRRAKNTNGGIVLLFIIPEHDAQQWIGVQEFMRAEAREEAETIVTRAAEAVRGSIGIEAEIVIREGDHSEEINAVVEDDRDIAILVLAAGPSNEGPGPLVSLLSGRAKSFSIPVTVLPDGLDESDIDALC